jgi:zinc protease
MSNPLRSFRFVYRTGSAYDPPGKEGLAQLTASLMSAGSTTRRSYKEILDQLFVMAAQWDCQVDQELTVFIGVTHQDHLAAFEQLTREMLHEPAFTADDFERLRQDQLNDLGMNLRGSNDEEMAKELLYSRVLRQHPYRHPAAGSISSLESITLDDVRAFFAAHFQQQGLAARPALALPAAPIPNGLHATLVDKPSARSVAMSFGFPIEVRRGHPDYPALLVAQAWLGQHRNGGRLFDQIRELRGLNYGDYAYIEYFPRGMFQFEPDPNLARQQQIFQVWLRPVEWEKAAFAFRLALHEIDQLRSNGMSEEDFERTRLFLRKYSKLLQKTESLRLGYEIDSHFYGIPEYSAYMDASLGSLTLADVNRATAAYLQTGNLHFVAVGPRMEEFAAQLRSNSAAPPVYEGAMADEVLSEDAIVQLRSLKPESIELLTLEAVFA